jgi:hypothetical protein
MAVSWTYNCVESTPNLPYSNIVFMLRYSVVTMCVDSALAAPFAGKVSSPGGWISLSPSVGLFTKNAYLEYRQTCTILMCYDMIGLWMSEAGPLVCAFGLCLCVCKYVYIHTHTHNPADICSACLLSVLCFVTCHRWAAYSFAFNAQN